MHYWGIPLTLAYIAFFAWLITRLKHFRLEIPGQKNTLLFFGYKLLMGFALTLIYTYYYQDTQNSDIYKYYNDSAHMTAALREHPSDFFKMLFGIGNDTPYFTEHYYAKMNHWFRMYETQQYNDNHTMIRFNAVVRIFSGGYFYVHTVFMCFLSFWGMVSFYRGFRMYLPEYKHKILAFALFLFPSLTFWSAGVLKEGLLIFALGNIFYAVCLLCHRRRSYGFYFVALFSLLLSLYLKSYALAAMLAGLAVLAGTCLNGYRKPWLIFTGIVVLIVILTVAVDRLFPQYDIPAIIAQKHGDFIRLNQAMQAGSVYDLGPVGASWGDLLAMAPKAFFTGVFRPLPHEGFKSILMLMSAGESLLFIAALVLCFVFFSRPAGAETAMILCSLLVVIIIGTLIGLSTANFGSLVRYKVPFIPFIVYAFIALIDTRRIFGGQTKTPL